MSARPAVPDQILDRLRLTCLDLPGAREQQAWVGARFVIGKKNFAHVLMIAGGWPPAYAKAARTPGPACVLTFRGDERALAAPRFSRPPFFRPPWFRDIAGVILDDDTDWDELTSLLRRSYAHLAPRHLAAQLDLTGD